MRYKVLVGISYRDRRAEPGDVVDDLTSGEAEWMLADGVIEPAPLERGGVVSKPTKAVLGDRGPERVVAKKDLD